MDEKTFVQQLTQETVNDLFEFYLSMSKDQMSVRRHALNFVNEFVQLIIEDALADVKKGTSKMTQAKRMYINFMTVQQHCAEAMSEAFQSAILKYSGQQVNYICIIKQISHAQGGSQH